MPSTAAIALRFGDGQHLFDLAIGPMRIVQTKCDAGPMELLRRLQNGDWRIDDVREPILQGLIGGGLAPTQASVEVERWVDARPWAETIPVAFAAISAAVMGLPDEDVGEPAGEGAATTLSPEGSSGSESSTPPPRARSGGRRGKSTSTPSGS